MRQYDAPQHKLWRMIYLYVINVYVSSSVSASKRQRQSTETVLSYIYLYICNAHGQQCNNARKHYSYPHNGICWEFGDWKQFNFSSRNRKFLVAAMAENPNQRNVVLNFIAFCRMQKPKPNFTHFSSECCMCGVDLQSAATSITWIYLLQLVIFFLFFSFVQLGFVYWNLSSTRCNILLLPERSRKGFPFLPWSIARLPATYKRLSHNVCTVWRTEKNANQTTQNSIDETINRFTRNIFPRRNCLLL